MSQPNTRFGWAACRRRSRISLLASRIRYIAETEHAPASRRRVQSTMSSPLRSIGPRALLLTRHATVVPGGQFGNTRRHAETARSRPYRQITTWSPCLGRVWQRGPPCCALPGTPDGLPERKYVWHDLRLEYRGEPSPVRSSKRRCSDQDPLLRMASSIEIGKPTSSAALSGSTIIRTQGGSQLSISEFFASRQRMCG